MKIKIEHYALMEKRIKRFMWHNKHLASLYLAGTFPNANKVKDLYKRFIWDIYYYAMPSKWTCDNLYPYLDDSHIETALKKLIPRPEGFPK